MAKSMDFEGVLAGFLEMKEAWLREADNVLRNYLGCDERLLPLAMDRLDRLGLEVAKYIEQADDGCWPREVLPILAQVMKGLVEKAKELELNAKSKPAFILIDNSNIPLVHKPGRIPN